MSQSIPTGYIPPRQPPGLAQKTCPGGLGFYFKKLPGGWDFVKNENETSHTCVDQIFTGEDRITSRIFDDF